MARTVPPVVAGDQFVSRCQHAGRGRRVASGQFLAHRPVQGPIRTHVSPKAGVPGEFAVPVFQTPAFPLAAIGQRHHVVPVGQVETKFVLEDLHQVGVVQPTFKGEKQVLRNVLIDPVIVVVLGLRHHLHRHAGAVSVRVVGQQSSGGLTAEEKERDVAVGSVHQQRLAIEPVQQGSVLPVAHMALCEAEIESVQHFPQPAGRHGPRRIGAAQQVFRLQLEVVGKELQRLYLFGADSTGARRNVAHGLVAGLEPQAVVRET